MSPTDTTTDKSVTWVDVAAAITEEDGADSPALDILGVIMQHQQASADHFQSMQDAWLTEANTKLLMMQHAIGAGDVK